MNNRTLNWFLLFPLSAWHPSRRCFLFRRPTNARDTAPGGFCSPSQAFAYLSSSVLHSPSGRLSSFCAKPLSNDCELASSRFFSSPLPPFGTLTSIFFFFAFTVPPPSRCVGGKNPRAVPPHVYLRPAGFCLIKNWLGSLFLVRLLFRHVCVCFTVASDLPGLRNCWPKLPFFTSSRITFVRLHLRCFCFVSKNFRLPKLQCEETNFLLCSYASFFFVYTSLGDLLFSSQTVFSKLFHPSLGVEDTFC